MVPCSHSSYTHRRRQGFVTLHRTQLSYRSSIICRTRGLSDSLIQMLGHWKSSAFQWYVRTPTATLLSVPWRLTQAFPNLNDLSYTTVHPADPSPLLFLLLMLCSFISTAVTVLLALYRIVVWGVRCCLCVLVIEQQFSEVTHVRWGRVTRVEGNGKKGK